MVDNIKKFRYHYVMTKYRGTATSSNAGQEGISVLDKIKEINK